LVVELGDIRLKLFSASSPRGSMSLRKARNARSRSLVLDRVFRDVGRIKLASGTRQRDVFNQVNAMLSTLYSKGRLDLLSAVQKRRISPLGLWDAYRDGRLEQVSAAEMLLPLVETFREWRLAGNTRTAKPWSPSHALGLSHIERSLVKHAAPGATVKDLPAIVRAIRVESSGRQVQFDHERVCFMAFLRDICGKSSPTYLEVVEIDRFNKPTEIKRSPLRVGALIEWTRKLDSDVAACCWAMASTGMGPLEYWGAETDPIPWERREHSIWIAGAKKAGQGKPRTREVPDLGRCDGAPPISRGAFVQRLREQTGGAFKPYDLRRTFANWLEAAGIPRTRVKMYLGHSLSEITDLYTSHDVSEYLQSDGELLRRWIDQQTHSLTPDAG
jgi:hypothetical protein